MINQRSSDCEHYWICSISRPCNESRHSCSTSVRIREEEACRTSAAAHDVLPLGHHHSDNCHLGVQHHDPRGDRSRQGDRTTCRNISPDIDSWSTGLCCVREWKEICASPGTLLRNTLLPDLMRSSQRGNELSVRVGKKLSLCPIGLHPRANLTTI